MTKPKTVLTAPVDDTPAIAEARVAGADTREAAATATVRRAATAAALIAAPALAVAFAAPDSWQQELGFARSLIPWTVIALIATGVASAIVAYRQPLPEGLLSLSGKAQNQEALRLPPGAGVAAIVALGSVVIAARDDDGLALTLVAFLPALAGWAIGRAARIAAASVATPVVAAAGGIVISGVLTGHIGAAHLGGIAGGGGLSNAAQWTAVYAVAAGAQLIAARMSLPPDRLRVHARLQATAAAVQVRSARGMATREQPPLLIEGLTVAFGATTILKDVDAQAARGNVVALVGANGAGKSTLLRAAAGFVVPQAGRVLVCGQDVTMLRAEERADAGLAFISGARPIFPDLTVMENLRVAAFRSHLTQKSFSAATDAVLDLVPALADRRREKAGVLSGGEQRLLAVAQALYRRPSVLLADELSLGLDLPSRLSVLDLLRVLADEGAAIMIVDHDLATLLPRSDRALLLSDGGASVFEKPKALLDQRSDLLPATFLADAAV